jgi:hypothetical protein
LNINNSFDINLGLNQGYVWSYVWGCVLEKESLYGNLDRNSHLNRLTIDISNIFTPVQAWIGRGNFGRGDWEEALRAKQDDNNYSHM